MARQILEMVPVAQNEATSSHPTRLTYRYCGPRPQVERLPEIRQRLGQQEQAEHVAQVIQLRERGQESQRAQERLGWEAWMAQRAATDFGRHFAQVLESDRQAMKAWRQRVQRQQCQRELEARRAEEQRLAQKRWKAEQEARRLERERERQEDLKQERQRKLLHQLQNKACQIGWTEIQAYASAGGSKIPDNGLFVHVRTTVAQEIGSIPDGIQLSIDVLLTDGFLQRWLTDAVGVIEQRKLDAACEGHDEQERLERTVRGGWKAWKDAGYAAIYSGCDDSKVGRRFRRNNRRSYASWKVGTRCTKSWGRHKPQHARQ